MTNRSTWRSSLCDCGNTEPDACEVCLCGALCPAVVYGATGSQRETPPPHRDFPLATTTTRRGFATQPSLEPILDVRAGKIVRGLDDDRLPALCSCSCDSGRCLTFFLLDFFTLGLPCVSGLYTCGARTKLRHVHRLPVADGCPSDCCAHFLCNRCAITQDFVQLRAQLRTARRRPGAIELAARPATGGAAGAVSRLGASLDPPVEQRAVRA